MNSNGTNAAICLCPQIYGPMGPQRSGWSAQCPVHANQMSNFAPLYGQMVVTGGHVPDPRDARIAQLESQLEAARCKLVNRTYVRIEILRALIDHATSDKQFPIDEPYNQYLREAFAAIDAAMKDQP